METTSTMKRYQCIKTYYMSDAAQQMPGEVAFKAGSVYSGTLLPDGRVKFSSEISPIHTLSETSVGIHFQELLDLNVDDPYTDSEAHEYELLKPAGCARGAIWAIVITAVIITLYAIFS